MKIQASKTVKGKKTTKTYTTKERKTYISGHTSLPKVFDSDKVLRKNKVFNKLWDLKVAYQSYEVAKQYRGGYNCMLQFNLTNAKTMSKKYKLLLKEKIRQELDPVSAVESVLKDTIGIDSTLDDMKSYLDCVEEMVDLCMAITNDLSEHVKILFAMESETSWNEHVTELSKQANALLPSVYNAIAKC